jgi:hypothetical protein
VDQKQLPKKKSFFPVVFFAVSLHEQLKNAIKIFLKSNPKQGLKISQKRAETREVRRFFFPS